MQNYARNLTQGFSQTFISDSPIPLTVKMADFTKWPILLFFKWPFCFFFMEKYLLKEMVNFRCRNQICALITVELCEEFKTRVLLNI